MHDKAAVIKNSRPEVDQFNNVPWHDAKFLGLSVSRDEKQGFDVVCWFLQLWQGDFKSQKKAILIFEEATIVRTNLDLDGKRVAADDIADASCMVDSELKQRVEKELRYEQNPLRDYLHFQLDLVDPGGQITVFAKSFRLVWGEYPLPDYPGLSSRSSAV